MPENDIVGPVPLNGKARKGRTKGLPEVGIGGITHLEFVAELVGKQATPLHDAGLNFVVDPVSGVIVLEGGSVGSATTQRAGVGVIVAAGIQKIIGGRKGITRRDVPVQLEKSLLVVGIVLVVLVRTRCVPEFLLQYLRDGIEVSGLHPTDLFSRNARPAGQKVAAEIFAALQFEVGEEEDFVFDNRPSDACPGLYLVKIGHEDIVTRHAASRQMLVAKETKDRAPKVIGSAFGNGVDGRPRKSGLRNVVGREIDLDLFDGIERDGLGITLSAGSGRIQTEGIVEDRTVERKVVVLVVATTEAIAIGARRKAGEITCRPADRGQPLQDFRADLGSGTGTITVDYAVTSRADHYLVQDLTRRAEREVELSLQAERKLQTLFRFLAESHESDHNSIGPADAQVIQIVVSLVLRHGTVLRADGLVHDQYGGPGQAGSIGIDDLAREGGRCSLGANEDTQCSTERGK